MKFKLTHSNKSALQTFTDLMFSSSLATSMVAFFLPVSLSGLFLPLFHSRLAKQETAAGVECLVPYSI